MAVKKWRGKWCVDFQVGERRIRRVSPTQSRRGAEAYEAELRASLIPTSSGSPEPAAIESPTLAEFAPEFLLTYARVNNKPAERSRKENVLRNHLVPFFGNQRLDQITPRRLEAFKADRLAQGLKPVTVNKHLGVLKKLLNCAVEWGKLAKVPRIRMLKAGVTDDSDEWLLPEEVGQLLEAAEAEPKWRTFFFIAVRAGLRRGEVFALHWRDIDFDAKRIYVNYTVYKGTLQTPKGDIKRWVPLSDDLADALRAWRLRSQGKLVFPNGKGKLTTSPSSANKALARVLKGGRLRHVRVHDLRHTFASHLVLQGCSLRVVQKLLGHSSIKMTERYAPVGDRQLSAAVASLNGLGFDRGGAGGDEEE